MPAYLNAFTTQNRQEKMASTTKLRSSSSFPNLLLSSLNLFLFFLSSASFVPIFLFRSSPTSFGWALFIVSVTTLLSSLVGFYSLLAHLCFIAHISLVLASSIGQVLGFLSLFLQHEESLQLLGSVRRSRREQWVLLTLEEVLLLGMLSVQSIVLISTCVVQKWWAREYEEVEAERDKAAKKRSRRMARVQEEAMANAEAMAELKAREMNEKMSKYGQLMKNDLEG